MYICNTSTGWLTNGVNSVIDDAITCVNNLCTELFWSRYMFAGCTPYAYKSEECCRYLTLLVLGLGYFSKMSLKSWLLMSLPPVAPILQQPRYWLCITWRSILPQIARFMGPTWGPPGSCQPQMGPVLAPWTLLSGTPWNGTIVVSGIYGITGKFHLS